MHRVIVAGCGYIGRRLASAERAGGAVLLPLVRSMAARQRLWQQGFHCLQVDLDQPPPALPLHGSFATLYYLVPPPAKGRCDPRSRQATALFNPFSIRHVVLISTTGVYGDCAGRWVDESQPLNAVTERGLRRIHAENVWRQWTAERGIGLAILRVAGIYAQDRLPEQRIRDRIPVLASVESPFSNRIHADDVVSACLAAARQRYHGVLNIADDQPSTMTDYFFQVADALGLQRPPAISMAQAREQCSAGMMSYLRESRRVDNTRIKRALGIRLRYPSLRDGLRDLLRPG